MGPGSPPQLEQLQQALEEAMPGLLDEVSELLEQGWPEYARFLVAEREEVLRGGGAFVERLVDVARGFPGDAQGVPGRATGITGDLFESIGRLQWRAGHDLTTLLTAYQVGARAAWSHVSQAALRLELDPSLLASLAAAVFEFVGELSSASAHGYAEEQSESSRIRERLRDELTQLLLSGRAAPAAVAAAAARAGWPLPREAAVVLVNPEDEVARTAIERAESRCLRVHHDDLVGLIVPDARGPGQMSRLRASLEGTHAVIGHPVPLPLLPSSTRVARVAERLLRSGVLTSDPVMVADCLDTIIVHTDDRLLGALRHQVLAPLDQLTPAARERLTRTLTSWLRHAGDRQAVARELHVHPQTVKYRIGQLRTLFGGRLDDPDERARVFLALNWGPPGGS